MIKLPLTQGYVTLIDDEDYNVLSTYKWRALIDRRKDGSIRNVYARSNVGLLHRILLGITNPRTEVDHIDFDGLNNQKMNLRQVSKTQNQQHKRARASGTKGVNLVKRTGKWRIRVQKEYVWLGSFTNVEDACKAYDEAALKYHREFAVINGRGLC